MRCEEARPLISAGLDGELDGICAARLRTHLTECVSCSTEREMLTATVRLLRDLPETEPPAALRRRIGVALLEAERASQRRWSGLASLVWPHAPGWAWGATMGATVAAVALLVPSHRGRSQRVVVLPNTAPSAAPVLPVPVQPRTTASHGRKLAVVMLNKAVTIKPRLALPSSPNSQSAALPPVGASDAATVARSGLAPLPAPSNRHLIRSHQAHHLIVVARHVNQGVPALAPPHGTPAPSNMPPDRSVRSADDSTRIAQTGAPSSTNPATAQLPDQDSAVGTSGMTQMATSGMPAGQETGVDDLTELRHRLIDRPLQVPELGQLKPATSHLSRDGWIRF